MGLVVYLNGEVTNVSIMNDRISLVLRTKNITPSQLADEIGVQRSGVSHILNGRNKPSLDFIQKLLKRYPDISMAWLMLGEGAMMNPYPSTGGVANKPPASKAPLMDLFQLDDDPQDEASSIDQPEEYYDDDELPDSSEVEDLEEDDPTQEIVSRNEERLPYNRASGIPEKLGNSIPARESANKHQRQTPGISAKESIGIPGRETLSKQGIQAPGISGKEITRIVIFYSDRSFTEYYPGNE